ncbi:MAG: transglutaminase domain-containing protein, partial [Bacillota bacterium]
MRIVHRLQAGLAIVALLLGAAAAAQVIDAERLAQIDAHALAAPPEAETAPGKLARYLAQPARNDAEKARAIFRWIADRIHYDVNAYFGEKLEKIDADQVLAQRGAACDGYATLFEALG